ncbi:hypothetical protein O988_03100 [Pseudogymnoascus sp. VKM F-3808]|nr:hypothetical protein O988_03100 [Pseudogymnoascus sp. VKM F-3808]
MNRSHKSSCYIIAAPVEPEWLVPVVPAYLLGPSRSESASASWKFLLVWDDDNVSLIYESEFYTAYGAYEGGKLKRMALINLKGWNIGTSPRPSFNFQLHIPVGLTSDLYVQQFQSPNGARGLVDDITWRGCQWTYASLGKTVTGVRNDAFYVLANANRVATINLPNTQAYIVNFYD